MVDRLSIMHRLALLEHGSCSTRCGIHLSDTDTSLTAYGSPIETTYFDHLTTCRDCIKGAPKRPTLRVVK